MTDGNLLIKNANIIDVTDRFIKDTQSILIREGRIVQIGKDIVTNNTPQLNVNGAYILPGLIDAHVHLMWGPGAVIQNFEAPNEENWKKGWGKYLSGSINAFNAIQG